MPKVTEEHKAEMRRRIQDAALVCIMRNGFAGASMADIVKEARLSAGAVYVYYRSKSELAIDVGRRIMEERLNVLTVMSRSEHPQSPAAVVPVLVDKIFSEETTAGLAVQVWGEAVHDAEFAQMANGIFDEITGRIEEYLRSWFERGAHLGEKEAAQRAAVLSPALMALMQGCLVQYSILGKRAAQQCRDAIEELLTDI